MKTNNIKLHNEAQCQPYLKPSSKYTPKELSSKLLKTLTEGYNSSIEPFLIIGLSIMAPYRKWFLQKSKGFPVAYLYGQTSSGKTNLLNTITYLYGLDEISINSGDSTIASIWYKLASCYSMPIIYDELSKKALEDSEVEGVFKGAYQGIHRETVTKGKTPVNATLIASSNYLPPQKPEILNRLLLCSFRQQSFNRDKVIDFNSIREEYLSNLLPEILKTTPSEVMKIFDEVREIVKSINDELDNRSVDNIAIAFTGYNILLDIAEEDEIPIKIDENFEQFVQKYNENLEIESPFDEFLKAIRFLVREYRLFENKDYCIEHNFDPLDFDSPNEPTDWLTVLILHFEQAYKPFVRHYKAIHGCMPPSAKEILFHARNDKRVRPGKDQTTKLKYINGKRRRCLEIDITKLEFLHDLNKEKLHEPWGS